MAICRSSSSSWRVAGAQLAPQRPGPFLLAFELLLLGDQFLQAPVPSAGRLARGGLGMLAAFVDPPERGVHVLRTAAAEDLGEAGADEVPVVGEARQFPLPHVGGGTHRGFAGQPHPVQDLLLNVPQVVHCTLAFLRLQQRGTGLEVLAQQIRAVVHLKLQHEFAQPLFAPRPCQVGESRLRLRRVDQQRGEERFHDRRLAGLIGPLDDVQPRDERERGVLELLESPDAEAPEDHAGSLRSPSSHSPSR